MTPITKIEDLPALLGGRPAGTTYRITGYTDSSGTTSDLTVRTLGPEGYADLKAASLKILEQCELPESPGFSVETLRAAKAALIQSYQPVAKEDVKAFKDPYEVAEAGGYAVKAGEAAIYLLRLESLGQTRGNPTTPETRFDLVRAKSALVKTLELPTGRYLHALKLVDNKFLSFQLV